MENTTIGLRDCPINEQSEKYRDNLPLNQAMIASFTIERNLAKF